MCFYWLSPFSSFHCFYWLASLSWLRCLYWLTPCTGFLGSGLFSSVVIFVFLFTLNKDIFLNYVNRRIAEDMFMVDIALAQYRRTIWRAYFQRTASQKLDLIHYYWIGIRDENLPYSEYLQQDVIATWNLPQDVGQAAGRGFHSKDFLNTPEKPEDFIETANGSSLFSNLPRQPN